MKLISYMDRTWPSHPFWPIIVLIVRGGEVLVFLEEYVFMCLTGPGRTDFPTSDRTTHLKGLTGWSTVSTSQRVSAGGVRFGFWAGVRSSSSHMGDYLQGRIGYDNTLSLLSFEDARLVGTLSVCAGSCETFPGPSSFGQLSTKHTIWLIWPENRTHLTSGGMTLVFGIKELWAPLRYRFFGESILICMLRWIRRLAIFVCCQSLLA